MHRSWKALPALAALAVAAPAAVAAEPAVEFTNTGKDCRNLLVSGDLVPEVARELVPKRFDIGDEPTGFVELASCQGGELDGRPLGPFKLAEAAVDIAEPAPVPGSKGTTGGHIYALTQLDTNPTLSARKRAIGFTSELVDIDLQPTAPLATRLSARIPWPTSPYTMTADVTPEGAPVPGVTLVTRIWGQGPKGVVVTHNDIQTIKSGSAGVGTARFQEGSLLARLFGTTTLTGSSISGVGDFVNKTYVIEPAATPPAPAPVAVAQAITARVTPRRRLVVKGPGALVVTVSRGRKVVKVLRGSARIAWDARGLRRGAYVVRVRRAGGRTVLRTFRLTAGRRGLSTVR